MIWTENCDPWKGNANKSVPYERKWWLRGEAAQPHINYFNSEKERAEVQGL